MPNAFSFRTIHRPRNPFEKGRLLREIQIVGKYGLKNKHELWRAEKNFADDKKEARILLTSTNPEDLSIKGRDLIERLTNNGILSGIDLTSRSDVIAGLNTILSLTIDNYLERRLQFRVFAAGLARSVYHARNLIARKQISILGKIVQQPGYIVKAEEEGSVEFAPFSYSAGNKVSRRQRVKGNKAE